MSAASGSSKMLNSAPGIQLPWVRPPPMMIAAETGISRRDKLMPVRAVKRETTGKYRAVAEVF